jgi:predicted unusual protein kinase regulating ubiquinone biosynthesis (AarF/ABC1/UbiB family)
MGLLEDGKKAVALGKAAKGIAGLAKDAGESSHHARIALRDLMSDSRGVVMKVGQFIAGRDDDPTDPLKELYDNIHPYPLAEIRGAIESQLGKPIDKVFSEFEEAKAAASLGQVHRARLRADGTEVAVKVRYPNIIESVASEMKVLGWLPGFGPVKRWGVDLDGYREMLQRNMDRELNYLQEADHQDHFAETVRLPSLTVPRIHRKYCREGLLVQDWHSGQRIDEVAEWPADKRKAMGEALLRLLLASVFREGFVHGDPHSGNFFVEKGGDDPPTLTLLDFGCIIRVDEVQRLAMLRLIMAIRERDDVDTLALFVAMGFDGEKLAHIAPLLPAIARALFAPFLPIAGMDRPYDLKNWRLKERVTSLLGDLRWWFRSAGPPNQLLLMRAFLGTVHRLQNWEVEHKWWPLLTAEVGEEMIEAARNFVPPALPPELTQLGRAAADMPHKLCIEVRRNGELTASVSLPGTAIDSLNHLIPEDVQETIAARKIDVTSLLKAALVARRYPHDLFTLVEDDKVVRVWLE